MGELERQMRGEGEGGKGEGGKKGVNNRGIEEERVVFAVSLQEC